MRGRWIGTVACLSLLALAAGVFAEEEQFFLNGRSVQLVAAPVEDEGGLLVPLSEFGSLIGIEVTDEEEGSVALRWSGGRDQVRKADLPVLDGEVYVSLEWIVGLTGGITRRLGSATYVEVEAATVSEFDVSEECVVLRFDEFVPVEVLAVDSESFRIRFHHCSAPFSHRSVVLGDGPMSRVEAQFAGSGRLDVFVSLREIGALRMRRFEADGFFSVTVEVGERTYSEFVTEIGDDRELVESEFLLAAGATCVNYERIEAWRTRYRVRPSIAITGLGDLVPLSTLVNEQSAAVGLGAGETVTCLVIDGVPLSLTSDEEVLLAVDAFGRLSAVRGTGRAVLRAEGSEMPIDDVGRPIRYGEAIAYPPGYRGEIAQGVPGGFSVLKVRGGKVVSVYHGTFVDRDPTATLIVASGEASARFAAVSLGDDAQLVCYTEELPERLQNAVSIEAVLVREGLAEDTSKIYDLEQARAWSVVIVDWHGGLIFLSIPQNERSAGAAVGELRAYLQSLSVPAKDAFVLRSSGSSSLAVSDRGCHELSDGDRVAVALLLVPMSE